RTIRTPRITHTPTPTLSPCTTLFRSPDDVRDDYGSPSRTAHRNVHERQGAGACPGDARRGAQSVRVRPLQERRGRMGSTRQRGRSEEHTSELQSRENLVCRLLLEKKR